MKKKIGLWVLGWVVVLGGANVWAESARMATIKQLKSLQKQATSRDLTLEIAERDSNDLVVGESFRLKAYSPTNGYLTLFYLDSEGNASLLYPGASVQQKTGQHIYLFPIDGEIPVQEPVGRNQVYAYLTEKAPDLTALGISPGGDFAVIDSAEQAAQMLATSLSDAGGILGAVRLQYFVQGAGEDDGRLRNISRILRTGSKLSVNEPILFDFGSANLSRAGQRQLDKWYELVLSDQQVTQSLTLTGHTDDVGDFEANKRLSLNRAKAVKQYLVDQHRMSASRIQVDGKGEASPVVPNSNEAKRAKNRRVEFTFR